MQTRREYAASLGLAIAGARGKFSNDAKDAIAAAEAAGQKFSDTPRATGPVEQTYRPAPKVHSAEIADYIFPSDFRWPEQEYKAVEVGGKTHGMREVCNNCRVSLVMCSCGHPLIHGRIPVTIEAR